MKQLPTLAFVEGLAKKAGEVVLSLYQKKGLEQHGKLDRNDIVTEADLASENLIRNTIKDAFPEHIIIAEEDFEAGHEISIDDRPTWIIDPLDGTVNFATQAGLFGVVIAYAEKREVQLVAIYLPFFNELFSAQRDKGAFLNGVRVHCTKHDEFAESLGCLPAIPRREPWLGTLYDECGKQNVWINIFGSASVTAAFVASGKKDWLYSPDRKLWDRAPEALLLQESGCVISDSQGKPWTVDSIDLVAANKKLHEKVIHVIKEIRSR